MADKTAPAAAASPPAFDVEIGPMRTEDIAAVRAIEADSFPTVWPADLYEAELAREPRTAYVVARLQPATGRPGGEVVGYGGMWMQADEAHIMTLAVTPGYRRLGIGERLLRRLLALALENRASFVTLEVRASNVAAKTLYRKFGFRQAGRRRAYYTDGEDALIMSTPDLDDPDWLDLFTELSLSPPGAPRTTPPA